MSLSPMVRLARSTGILAAGKIELRRIHADSNWVEQILVSSEENLDRIVRVWNESGWNVYYGANPRGNEPGGRGSVKCGVCVHADIDDASLDTHGVLSRLADLPTPTALVASGGGFHVYYALDPRDHARLDEVETANHALAHRAGGDTGCWDVSRVLRVPGTTNWPCPRKRAKGRVVAETSLSFLSHGAHRLNDLLHALRADEIERPVRAAPVDVHGLGTEPLSDEEKARLLLHGKWPKVRRDRSAADYEVAVNAYMRGATDEQAARLLYNTPWGKAREKGEGYVRVTLANAKAQAKANSALDRAIGEWF